MAASTSVRRRVAVVDDNQDSAAVVGLTLEDAGFTPVLLGGPFTSVGELVDKITGSADAAVCDHRLRPRAYAPFDGAEVVACLYKKRIPAILVTQFSNMDADLVIRSFRRHIPVLLHRDQADASGIIEAFDLCDSELAGRLPEARRPVRTLVRIISVSTNGGVLAVDAIVPQWNPYEAIRFAGTLVPQHLHGQLATSKHLLARVNVGAKRQEDLFLEEFELAPEPVDEGAI
jgi:CheY-like chemotaxis protein